MSRPTSSHGPIERSAWIALLATVALVPLAVGKLPGSTPPFLFTFFGYPQMVVLLFGTAVTAGLWAVAAAVGQSRTKVSWQMAALGAFVAWAGVSTAMALEPLRSLFGRSTSSLSMVGIVTLAALTFLVVQLVDGTKRMRTLAWTLVGSGTVVAALALLQQFFGTNLFGGATTEEWITGRGFATIGNPDQLGTFLVLPLGIALWLAFTEVESTLRWTALGTVAALTAALTGTLTRGAWIAAAVSAVLAVALVWRSRSDKELVKKAGIALGVMVVAAAIAIAASNSADLATRFGGVPTSAKQTALSSANAITSDRINVWRAALAIVGQRPLTGTGPAAFELGWYGSAIDPTSGAGGGAIADDTHSLPVFVLATTGWVGLAAFLAFVVWALVVGARASWRLTAAKSPFGSGTVYAGWFVGAAALQVALLVGAISPPLVMYAFLSLGVLICPVARPVGESGSSLARLVAPAAGGFVAVALLAAVYPTLAAELGAAKAHSGAPSTALAAAAERAPWNPDIQGAYFSKRVAEVNAAIAADPTSGKDALAQLVDELSTAEAAHPKELYYPALQSQVLSAAAVQLNDKALGDQALTAADRALAIMPASIPVRVQMAQVLGTFERYDEMAEALADYWENETGAAYPGILYGQALALGGKTAEADAVFAELMQRFPAEAADIEAAKASAKQPQAK